MKASEIRKLDDDSLKAKIVESSKELFDLRMSLSTGNLENTHHIKALKKNIARMKLIDHERILVKGQNGKK